MIPFKTLQKEIDRFTSLMTQLEEMPDKHFDLDNGRAYRMGIKIWSELDQIAEKIKSFSDKAEAPREKEYNPNDN